MARIRSAADGNSRQGFTLVELLVVITIIGILMSLLLPAVQSARESARSAQCANNVKQFALAALEHVTAAGFFPTGGWGWNWAGDPDRGYGLKQPGGWVYNVLPFVEQKNLWSLGQGISEQSNLLTKMTTMIPQLTTVMSMLQCPSRRAPALFPTGATAWNVSPESMVSKCDYAMNAGDCAVDEFNAGPSSLAAGDPGGSYQWSSTTPFTGVSFQQSQITMAHVTKGASSTYLLGDKYMDPDNYYNGQDYGDNEWATVGFDCDIYRTADANLSTGNPPDTPMQDTSGYMNWKVWGSAHPTGLHMAFCDGSIHNISFSIDYITHADLANRSCSTAVDPTKVQ